LFFVLGQNPVIEQVCGSDGMFAGVQVGKSDLSIGFDEGLLVDASNTFDGAHIVGVLRSQVTGMLGFYLAFLVLPAVLSLSPLPAIGIRSAPDFLKQLFLLTSSDAS